MDNININKEDSPRIMNISPERIEENEEENIKIKREPLRRVRDHKQYKFQTKKYNKYEDSDIILIENNLDRINWNKLLALDSIILPFDP